MSKEIEKVLADKLVFADETECVAAWSGTYRSMSREKEAAAFLYSVTYEKKTVFYLGRTLNGTKRRGAVRANVFFPFLYFYLVESLLQWYRYRAQTIGLLHTHPAPEEGFTDRFHSREDLWLLKLPRIRAVYVIPYENQEINKAVKKEYT